MDDLPRVLGEILRRARLARGMSLRDVQSASRGRFKPSVVGGYERCERGISLERFCELAALYGVPADRLLGEALANLEPGGRREIVLDLSRLAMVSDHEGRLVAEFVHNIRAMRGDYLSTVITLRSGDLESLALRSSMKASALLARLRPALFQASPSRP